jgi:hypothetical protein
MLSRGASLFDHEIVYEIKRQFRYVFDEDMATETSSLEGIMRFFKGRLIVCESPYICVFCFVVYLALMQNIIARNLCAMNACLVCCVVSGYSLAASVCFRWEVVIISNPPS